VVRSWLNDLAASAFAKNVELTNIQGFVADSGEGRWTVQEAWTSDVAGAGDHAVAASRGSARARRRASARR